jgi:2-phospho-L-lactate transferase/gluconeogenesis factor (CofD/UPF0052 family)
VPELARALVGCRSRRIVNLNLASQPGETDGYSPATHLEVLAAHAPDLRIDVVVADRSVESVRGAQQELEEAAATLGASVVYADLAAREGPERLPRHDSHCLAAVYEDLFRHGRIDRWP